MRKLLVIVAVSLAAALLGPVGSASANSSDTQIFSDCLHSPTGELQHTYSRAALNHALHHIPGDVAEYSGCYDAVQTQLHDQQTAGHTANAPGGNAHSPVAGGGTAGGGGTGGSGTGAVGGTSGGGTTGGTGSAGGPATSPGSTGTAGAGTPGTADGSAPAPGTGAAPATPHTGTPDPVRLANATVVPGTLPSLSQDGTALPTPLIVFLALLGAGALAIGGTTIGRRVLARRRA